MSASPVIPPVERATMPDGTLRYINQDSIHAWYRSPSRRALCPTSKALILAISDWHTGNAAEARNIAMAVLDAIERGEIPNVAKETP